MITPKTEVHKCPTCHMGFLTTMRTIKRIEKGISRGLCASCNGKMANSKIKNHKPGMNTGRTRFVKGQIVWNKGVHTGIKPWLGKKRSEETKEKISINRRGKMTGESHFGWKGGITPINKTIRTSSEYKDWRKSVFARDDYTCVNCGQHGGWLEADHIKPFSLFPDLRLCISNGRTLCKPCHKDIGWSLFKDANPRKVSEVLT